MYSTGASSIAPTKPGPTTELGRDVVLYKYENPRFFKLLNLFAISQFAFWAIISFNSTSLTNAPVKKTEKDEKEDVPFWRRINLGTDAFRLSMIFGSAFVGK